MSLFLGALLGKTVRCRQCWLTRDPDGHTQRGRIQGQQDSSVTCHMMRSAVTAKRSVNEIQISFRSQQLTCGYGWWLKCRGRHRARLKLSTHYLLWTSNTGIYCNLKDQASPPAHHTILYGYRATGLSHNLIHHDVVQTHSVNTGGKEHRQQSLCGWFVWTTMCWSIKLKHLKGQLEQEFTGMGRNGCNREKLRGSPYH